ncbi:MAG: fructosamine kinase family protein [Bacillus sp. (in: Bacteria)]|nr:fructosamine kinase family protein [Bacillus sp. (in: firmicutes)]
MHRDIKQAVTSINDHSEILLIKKVAGGEINEAFYIETERRAYFIKFNQCVKDDFFQVEVEGLLELKQSKVVRVPEIYGFYENEHTKVKGLLLQWITGEQTNETILQLGKDVAKLHQTKGEYFGFRRDTYIGEIPQRNGKFKSWLEYYRQNRLGAQMFLAEKQGYLTKKRWQNMDFIMNHLDQWIPEKVAPVLLHGDLWSENWLVGKGGSPYLIDPSILYGHHEFELAFTELFGGFPKIFYDQYHEITPIDVEYVNRKEIYQLFYLLVHLNVFGEMYGKQVDRILNKYTP